jgi:hypothetical protein
VNELSDRHSSSPATAGNGTVGADPAFARDTERLRYARQVVEHAYEQGWTDGLPVVPVTAQVVEEFLAAAPSTSPSSLRSRLPGQRHDRQGRRPHRAQRPRGRPHELEQATQGVAWRWSLCIGENEMEGPGIGAHGLHMLASPEQLLVVVVGARNAAMSMVVRPFGFGGWSRTAYPIDRVGTGGPLS